MTREEKLEAAFKAAAKLRRAIEPFPEEGFMPKSLLVPSRAVYTFDLEIQELINEQP